MLSRLFEARTLARARKIFDQDYYLQSNHDVEAAKFDPFQHFITHGWIEGRNPSSDFVTLFYRDTYLSNLIANPLMDYVRRTNRSFVSTKPKSEADYIRLQRNIVAAHFSPAFYQEQIGDVSQDPLSHYLEHGWKENRWPSRAFDPERYFKENAYVRGLNVSPLYHFASQNRMKPNRFTSGAAIQDAAETRTDASITMRSPEDAQTSAESMAVQIGGSPFSLGHALETSVSQDDPPVETESPELPDRTRHYTSKIIEQNFDKTFYLAINSDVRTAGNDPLEHYCLHGWREGRMPNRLF